MKKTNMMKRILCALLCLCMITGTLLAMASCNSGTPAPTSTPTGSDTSDTNQNTDNTGTSDTGTNNTDNTDNTFIPEPVDVEKVVILTRDVPAGSKLTADMFETVDRDATAIHLNAIRDVNKLLGKYTTQKLYKGEYIFAGKLTDKNPAEKNNDYKAYIVVTDEINESGDLATEIQKVIDKYPGRTIEFPDGEYVLSKPIVVYADPAKAVSIRLSDFAVIKPASNWSGSDAMFRLCVGTIPAESKLTETFYIQGGLFDGNGKATAISVENAENFFIANVDVKNSPLAFDLKGGILDMENVNIIGAGGSSVGIKAACNTSSFSNVRITDVATAVNATGNNNLFKSVYATYRNANAGTAAFVDTSKGNNYDMCTSEGFATGFSMGTGNNVYYGCYVKWTASSAKPHVAFQATGKYNSLIRTSRADFDFTGCNGAFLKVGSAGGAGKVLWPMIGGKNNMTDTSYSGYLDGTYVIER